MRIVLALMVVGIALFWWWQPSYGDMKKQEALKQEVPDSTNAQQEGGFVKKSAHNDARKKETNASASLILPDEAKEIYDEAQSLIEELKRGQHDIDRLQSTIKSDEAQTDAIIAQTDALLESLEQKGLVDYSKIKKEVEEDFVPLQDLQNLPEEIKQPYEEALRMQEKVESVLDEIEIIEEDESE